MDVYIIYSGRIVSPTDYDDEYYTSVEIGNVYSTFDKAVDCICKLHLRYDPKYQLVIPESCHIDEANVDFGMCWKFQNSYLNYFIIKRKLE